MVYTPIDELPTPPPRRPSVRWTDAAGREVPSEEPPNAADASVARNYLQAMREQLTELAGPADRDDPRRAAAIARARTERTHPHQVAS
jgi:hypothetical protein